MLEVDDLVPFKKQVFGLSYQETIFGAKPYINYSNLPFGYTARDLGNANYFKNFGSIPAKYLVRDFRYNGDQVF